jgi:hypothetical protein
VPEPYRCATAVKDERTATLGKAAKEVEANAKEASRVKTSGTATGKIIAAKEFVDRLVMIARTDQKKDFQAFSEKTVYLSFYLRSVEAMFYYLGEVARREQSAGKWIASHCVHQDRRVDQSTVHTLHQGLLASAFT